MAEVYGTAGFNYMARDHAINIAQINGGAVNALRGFSEGMNINLSGADLMETLLALQSLAIIEIADK